MGHFSGYFEGASTFLTLKFARKKKIISRIFKISGALIVIKARNLAHFRAECRISDRGPGRFQYFFSRIFFYFFFTSEVW
jgi:hypothetical protein